MRNRSEANRAKAGAIIIGGIFAINVILLNTMYVLSKIGF